MQSNGNIITEPSEEVSETKDGLVLDALQVLRNELTVLGHNTTSVHQVSTFMLCSSKEELQVFII